MSAWVANANAFDEFCGASYVYANIDFRAEYPSGTVLNTTNTGALTYAGTQLAWTNAGLSFTTQPGQTWVDVVIYNQGAGAFGNDFVIDDISLVHCPGALNPVIHANKSTYCEHDTIMLTQTGLTGYINPQYQWQYSVPGSTVFSDIPGATSNIYVINDVASHNSGSYQLLVSENGNINSPYCRIAIGPKAVTVWPSPSGLDLGQDTSICQGQFLNIHAPAGYAAYFWNNDFSDSVRQNIQVSLAGKYWVTVKDLHGCKASDTIALQNLYPLPLASAGTDTAVCAGIQVQLKAFGGVNYQWSTGGVSQIVLVNPQVNTTYSVTVYDAHQCFSKTQVTVYIKQSSQRSIFTNDHFQHCFEEGPIVIGPDWGNHFLWSNSGDTSQNISVTTPGSYAIKMLDELGCSVTGSILVQEYCEPKIFVPKAFSPNGDGTNDDLEIFGRNFTNFKLMVFNRWGEIIFISTDRNIRWDGMYRGEPMEIGTYPWIISYQSSFDASGKENKMEGSITLIR